MGNHTSHQYDKDGIYSFQGGVVVGSIKANVQAQKDFVWPIIFLLAFLLVVPLVSFLIIIFLKKPKIFPSKKTLNFH